MRTTRIYKLAVAAAIKHKIKEWNSEWDPLFLSFIVNAPGQLADGYPHHLQKRFAGAKAEIKNGILLIIILHMQQVHFYHRLITELRLWCLMAEVKKQRQVIIWVKAMI